MRLPCTCCGETNIALACSNFAILATTATNRNHTVFRLICTPKETGPIARLNNTPLLLLRLGTILNRGGTLRGSDWIRRTLVTSAWRPRPPHQSRPLLAEHEGLSCRVTLDQHILKRRHRCHNTQERFGELFVAVPVLHIAKEALQFWYFTYRQFD